MPAESSCSEVDEKSGRPLQKKRHIISLYWKEPRAPETLHAKRLAGTAPVRESVITDRSNEPSIPHARESFKTYHWGMMLLRRKAGPLPGLAHCQSGAPVNPKVGNAVNTSGRTAGGCLPTRGSNHVSSLSKASRMEYQCTAHVFKHEFKGTFQQGEM